MVDELVLTSDFALRWATRQVGVWGPAILVSGFLDSALLSTGRYREPLELSGWSFGRDTERLANTRAVPEQLFATVAADLGAVAERQGRMACASAVASAVLHHFGLAEAEQLSPDGSIRLGAWPNISHNQLQRWASSAGVSAG